jgi:hypothetical protein
MLDFTPFRNGEVTISELVAGRTIDDLRRLTDEMIDKQLELIATCIDDDVVFVPQDPEADDPFAASDEEMDMPWTLGHVIVHVTASSEEAAFMAAELARGVEPREVRSRYEVHWSTVTSIRACRHRLEESRRIRLASLDMWPDPPHLDNMLTAPSGIQYNAIARFVFGLYHDDDHLGQIADIICQSKAFRG